MTNIFSKIRNYVFSGATTLEKFIELCKKDRAPFINIMNCESDSFGDLYKIEYESPGRDFSEKICVIRLCVHAHPIYELLNDKAEVKTLERVLEATEKIKKAGIKVLYLGDSDFRGMQDIEYLKDEIKKRERELGLR